jgi:hypothetical protein
VALSARSSATLTCVTLFPPLQDAWADVQGWDWMEMGGSVVAIKSLSRTVVFTFVLYKVSK